MLNFDFKGRKIKRIYVNEIYLPNVKLKYLNKYIRVLESSEKHSSKILSSLSPNEFNVNMRILLNNYFEWLNLDHFLSFRGADDPFKRSIKKTCLCEFVCLPVYRKGVISPLIDPDFYLQELVNKKEIKAKFNIKQRERGFAIEFWIPSDEKIVKFIDDLEVVFKESNDTIINRFNKNVFQTTIVISFSFPEEIKVSCKQYLEYFATFLKDLGLNSNSNLKEEAGKVLFSVTPADDNEALDKIREALAVYLKLPSSPIVYDDSFAAMRLQQQIENLQHSQRMAVRELQFNEKLLVAQSETIREKNVTVSQQQSVIEQQNKIIEKISSKSIMMDSVENKEELEELYDGLKIGESKFLKEQLGIHLNPAKVIKTAVKNTFGKNEKKSVLGLDEETKKDN